jgi:hypothetical protein
MKKLLLLLPVLALLGCHENVYRVYYHSPDKTAGKVPVDSEVYRSWDRATVKGQGNLKNKDYNFLGWKYSNHRDTYYYNPGDYITIDEDINLYAVWDDGSNSPFSFFIKDGEVTITGFNEGRASAVTIPDILQGKNVTVIDDIAFSNLSITEVKFSKHLKRIGMGAFAGNKITRITIPDTVEYIGPGAFRDNPLRGVNLGTGLTALESQTFYNNKLVDIAIPENIKTVRTGVFAGNDIVFIELGPNVDIQGDTAFGTYGTQFRTFYNTKGKTAGRYQYNDTVETWE